MELEKLFKKISYTKENKISKIEYFKTEEEKEKGDSPVKREEYVRALDGSLCVKSYKKNEKIPYLARYFGNDEKTLKSGSFSTGGRRRLIEYCYNEGILEKEEWYSNYMLSKRFFYRKNGSLREERDYGVSWLDRWGESHTGNDTITHYAEDGKTVIKIEKLVGYEKEEEIFLQDGNTEKVFFGKNSKTPVKKEILKDNEKQEIFFEEDGKTPKEKRFSKDGKIIRKEFYKNRIKTEKREYFYGNSKEKDPEQIRCYKDGKLEKIEFYEGKDPTKEEYYINKTKAKEIFYFYRIRNRKKILSKIMFVKGEKRYEKFFSERKKGYDLLEDCEWVVCKGGIERILSKNKEKNSDFVGKGEFEYDKFKEATGKERARKVSKLTFEYTYDVKDGKSGTVKSLKDGLKIKEKDFYLHEQKGKGYKYREVIREVRYYEVVKDNNGISRSVLTYKGTYHYRADKTLERIIYKLLPCISNEALSVHKEVHYCKKGENIVRICRPNEEDKIIEDEKELSFQERLKLERHTEKMKKVSEKIF